MARRKKNQKAEDIVPGLIGLIVLIVFSYRLRSQGASSIDAMAGLLISSALWVVAFLVLAGIAYLALRKMVSPSEETNPRNNLFQSQPVPPLKSDQSTEQWTEELINQAEWRVFEKICMALWRIKDFAVEETQNGSDGGVDFYLVANATKRRIGAVQCKSWSSKQIGVGVVRELQGVIASEKLQLGILMYSGKLSKAAIDFLAKPEVTVKAQSAKEIFLQINKLKDEQKFALLRELITKDFETPTCPSCDVKLVERHPKNGGRPFWGCRSFPRCRYTLKIAN